MNKYIVFKSDFRKVDNIDEWTSFSDIGKTICACLSVENELVGKDFSGDIYD